MWRHDPRLLLLSALLLDWLGQLLVLASIFFNSGWLILSVDVLSLSEVHRLWLVFCLLLYPLLGWLFGSYTVLRWRRLAFPVLLQRLLITAMVTLLLVAFARWLFNPGPDVWLVHRRVQILWLGGSTAWSLLVRISLRRGLLLPDAPRLLLLARCDGDRSHSSRLVPCITFTDSGANFSTGFGASLEGWC